MRNIKDSPISLSVEEAAILVDEMDENEREAKAALAGATTATEVSGISDDVMRSVKNFDNAEMLALADAIGDMGSAAMGQITVVDYKPTVESFAGRLSNFWEKIVELLKKAWAFIKSFFERAFGYSRHLRDRIGDLRNKIANLSDKPIADKPIINVPMRDGKIFTVPGKKMIDTASFNEVMNGIFQGVSNNFKQGPVAITAVGDAFMEVIKGLTPEISQEEMSKLLAAKIIPAMWRYFDAFGVKDFKRDSVDSHVTNTFTATSPPVAGSCRVAFTWGTSMNSFFIARETDEPIAHVIRDLNIAKCVTVQEMAVAPSNTLTMPAMKPAGMKTACDLVIKGLDMIAELERNQKSKMHDFSQQFQTIAADVSRRFDGKDAGENQTTLNAMFNLPTTYTHLATQPMTDLVKRTVGTFEAILNMVEESTKMYQPKAA